MLGLIKTSDTVDLVCESDPAIGGEGDGWVLKNGHSGATVVTLRGLSDREMLRLSAVFDTLVPSDSPSASAAADFGDAMETICRAAFVSCREGENVTDDADIVFGSMRLGPLVALGNWVLESAGHGANPT